MVLPAGAAAASAAAAAPAAQAAAAATIAALLGPLRDSLAGMRVGVICCGTNMDFADYLDIMAVAKK